MVSISKTEYEYVYDDSDSEHGYRPENESRESYEHSVRFLLD